jgi:hypothetical protein
MINKRHDWLIWWGPLRQTKAQLSLVERVGPKERFGGAPMELPLVNEMGTKLSATSLDTMYQLPNLNNMDTKYITIIPPFEKTCPHVSFNHIITKS